jgi:hypothetical protein
MGFVSVSNLVIVPTFHRSGQKQRFHVLSLLRRFGRWNVVFAITCFESMTEIFSKNYRLLKLHRLVKSKSLLLRLHKK